MGTLLDFSAETNPPLPDGNSRRTYTARVVFQGNRVINQDWEAAMFLDWGNAPSTMEAPRSIGCYGCLPGHAEEQNDARHAYTQAFLKGTHTWDCLPKQQRPMACHHMRRPVVLATDIPIRAPIGMSTATIRPSPRASLPSSRALGQGRTITIGFGSCW